MTAIRLDGDVAAAVLKDDLRSRIDALAEAGVVPGLGTLLVGDDGPSSNYVSMKHRDATDLGLHTRDVRLGADASEADVLAAVDDLNTDPGVHAYIVQYPFPPGLRYEPALLAVDPAKDADGLHPLNLGWLVMGHPAPVACTPAGIVRLLSHYGVPVAGRHVVVVGRGLTIGRPLANLLALKRPDANAAVTVVHTGVPDIGAHTRTADIVVAAAGVPRLITPDMVRPGAAVINAGVTYVEGKLRSDVHPDVGEVAGWLSPAVGGVGSMTRAMLMANTVDAAERSVGPSGEEGT